ncbi:Glycine--tRNA ligase beta subunit [Piscirickettsia salmonis]|uniref:Glycine--tRNA ligase beta subunit n=1 Tax=Piscirickettsia salmonis TaxID=1238 RepID=A0A1L6TFF2_PISSA|nr:glycine--tRNA ligase subunit beta [Piscirickettsia salmonis]AKP72295.1 glycine--tRNA ligase subunit beta [Piscirickettsia salmonis LF-89 = ATCC VR-1361]ALB24263.1 glycyl-tRNA synthetase beta subunit [Piscirickettsia salmonis]ALY04064.1 glycine--tRNA ligase subunit beta [Piscirickettsia salmonis]AMA43617.1 glycine--tRNA ligase subunit beta [Piscirickettsia salmonis]AOS36086.1 glycine--tRNA ligase subunit beta [Piscirickettsia salmonis]
MGQATESFLFEIGTEELPPKSLENLAISLKNSFETALKNAKLNYGDIELFAAPRRIGLLIQQLDAIQPDQIIERRGPAVHAAFNQDGKPTPAALGFARSCNVSLEQIERLETAKGQWLFYKLLEKGAKATDLLPSIAEQAVKKLPIAKAMRWGTNKTQFVRPVHWITMLYGTDVITAKILELSADRITYGHRFHSTGAISLAHANDYAKTLKTTSYVIASFHERRNLIKNQLENIGTKVNGQVHINNDLLNEVTALVEWPMALLANFDKEFLNVPQEALISSMQMHQKCFAVLEPQTSKMLPHFVTISNIDSKNPATVISGNEKVMRARLADAAFFYQTDKKHTLESHLERLKTVTFQAKLGSVYERAERLASISGFIATHLAADIHLAKRAGLLAKTDLMSEMVMEFPELQGIMGRYYAHHDGEANDVALALEEQYLPRFAGDKLPQSMIGAAIALADKIDTLVGIFGIGQKPSGDKDPFALRRAALGLLRIIIENKLALNLTDLIQHSITLYSNKLNNKNTEQDVLQFINERLPAYYAEQSISPDTLEAVTGLQLSYPLDIDQRIQAVHRFRQLEVATALAAANKRVKNILDKQQPATSTISAGLLIEKAEKELYQAICAKHAEVQPLLTEHAYDQALESLASLRHPVDHFFDHVMVMAEDAGLQANRLALLAELRQLFLKVADISYLQN